MGKNKKEKGITTILGPDTTVEGTIGFQGTIRLDGKVNGKIASTDGTLIIGEKAEIHADITVDVARIMGEVRGVVTAQSRIEIYEPAIVEGDLHAPVVAIDAGVTFNGNCEMTPKTISISETKKSQKTSNSSG